MEKRLVDHLDILDECLENFIKCLQNIVLDHTMPYPGMSELIHELNDSGIRLGVTNKPHYLALRIVEHCFPRVFAVFRTWLYPVKPVPESTCIALIR